MLKTLTAGLLLAMSALAAQAQTDISAKKDNSAYASDGRGVVARTANGTCIRTGYWSPSDAVGGCDGPLTAPVAKVTAPAPAAAAPMPAPAAAPAPVVAAAPKRCDSSITLGADEAFAFNKSVLTPAAKAKLDAEVPGKLAACSKVDLLIVTGHADRIGSQQANQKLSEKRAEAVAAYLKSKGVDGPFDTMGVGKTQSIKPCDDKLPRKKLVECLAPNRRVVLEVRGPGK
jgi:OOP family OmpA-OmpF porin